MNDRLADIVDRSQFEDTRYPSWQDLRWLIMEVRRLRRLVETLEHPSGRPCPWCLSLLNEHHGQYCELSKALRGWTSELAPVPDAVTETAEHGSVAALTGRLRTIAKQLEDADDPANILQLAEEIDSVSNELLAHVQAAAVPAEPR